MQKISLFTLAAALLLIAHIAPASAAEERILTIKNHVFTPTNIELPADTKAKLIIKNLDATPEEFESHDLHVEKIVGGGKTITVLVGPLKPGVYKFFGEFHEKTAQGTITVK